MALLLATALPSCTRPLKDAPPPVAMPEAFSATGAQPTPDRWWLMLNDADLAGLVDQSLAGNMTLRILWDRVDQAGAVARRSAAPLYPAVDGTAGTLREREKRAGRPALYQTTLSVGLLADYEVDLWGRIRSTVNAADLEVQATREDLAAAAITLSATVANTWYRLVELRGQIALLDGQIRTNEQYLDLTTLRFRTGKVSAVDVLQQRQLVEATRSEKIQAESDLKVLEHQLAILVGRAPAAPVAAPGGHLPALPPLPGTGLPADLVRKRPDTRSAFVRLQEADQQIAAAVADQFPRLSLSATTVTSAGQLRDLFDNWLAGLAANMVAPLFDGGQRAAEVERTRAVASERLHFYGQTVLVALGEVENALVQERQQALFLTSVEQQLALASKATEQTRQHYVQGGLDFLRVLDALRSQQRLERDCLQARRELVGFRIDLYRALGGGWEMQRPEESLKVSFNAENAEK